MLSTVLQIIKDVLFFAAYVNTGSSFPEPLSKDDEAKYIQLCAQGNEEARGQLIEHNLRLVAHIAKKYTKKDDADDIISIGTIGLIKAVSSFNPNKGSLVAYASRCIENEILMYLRHEKKKNQREVSLDEPIGRDSDGNEVTIVDKLGSDADALHEDVSKSMLHDKLLRLTNETLNERERTVLTLRYSLDGDKPLAQREVAQVLGVSRSYISRIEKKALSKLSKNFDFNN